MKIVLFCHSIASDWNNGHAHFLRGVVTELFNRGHAVRVFEPADGWSRANLVADKGSAPLAAFARHFPQLRPQLYDPARFDVDRALDGADLAIVHEWTEPAVASAVARRRASGGRFRLLFHDTHHRSFSAPAELDAMGLNEFDGVLAFGEIVRQWYLRRGWGRRVWTWHEAADINVFRPQQPAQPAGDLVWVGNWGDDERTAELQEFLLRPSYALGLRTTVHGVRYPAEAQSMLERHRVAYAGWIANHDVPRAFARHAVTIHVPRRPYVRALPGIPTIRVFEALACGIPLISAPWDDAEGLFAPGSYLTAANGEEMQRHLRAVLSDGALAAELRARGLRTIRGGHTCGHRVESLLTICESLGIGDGSPARMEPAEAS
jgi:spore maturation protein CgeB